MKVPSKSARKFIVKMQLIQRQHLVMTIMAEHTKIIESTASCDKASKLFVYILYMALTFFFLFLFFFEMLFSTCDSFSYTVPTAPSWHINHNDAFYVNNSVEKTLDNG